STMRLPGGLRVSFASVFNAFPASYWRQWTRATAARLEITIKGRASVLVYKSNAQGRFIRIDSAAVDSETVEFDVPLKTFADGGWIWFDVIASD
ncbi:glycosyltransferase family 2 protein, partial [Pauljensenia sp. UMB6358]|nr:glycosyltransferase family 2 protein [Pauljensenia sp. UMB6358]